MENNRLPVEYENVEQRVLRIRGHNVLLDRDLAELYGVQTRRLNEQVRRNLDRFPQDFMFQLTPKEKDEVIANCDHLESLKFSKAIPLAFTEHGAIMAASVLNSPKAVEVSVFVVRAFVRLRQFLRDHAELAHRLDELEKKYDAQFSVVFDAIRALMEPPEKDRTELGFHV